MPANDAGRRRTSITLALGGAILALIGGVLLYARESVFDADALADRTEAALSDERLRLALAQPITDAALDAGPLELVNARPLIEGVVVAALDTQPVRAAVGEAVRTLQAQLFEQDPDTLLLDLADAASVALAAVEAVSPRLAERIPPGLTEARVELTESDVSIDTLALAQDVRLAGAVLPPLAMLALIGSVAVAPDRRRALVRVGLMVAGAALSGLILLLVGRSLLLGQFEDDLVADAVDAAFSALLGDLRTALTIAAVLSLVLAAAARFSRADEFDPLAPFARAAELLRARPKSALPAALRGLGLLLAGLVLVLRPGLSIEIVAVLAGAWVLYVGVGELLALLAPPIEQRARPSGARRVRPGRVAVGAVGVAAAILVVLLVARDGGDAAARPPGPPVACNGHVELCAKRFDELTIPATHNSMSAAGEAGWFLPNQRYGIEQQLDDGIRGLLIDTHYGIRRDDGRGFAQVITDLEKEGKTRGEVVAELGEEAVQKAEDLIGRLAFDGAPGEPELFLCHVLCELGATPLDDALTGIEAWLASHPDEFLVIFIEDVVGPEETAGAFERSGLLRYVWTPDPGELPPTLSELIETDRRLLVMAENDAGGGRYPWYQQGFDLVQETPYTFSSAAQIESRESCRPNRGRPDSPLFQINSWIERIPRDPGLAERIDAFDALLARARLCTRIRGLKPNLIAVDFYERGDVTGVANALNGLDPAAPMEVRELP